MGNDHQLDELSDEQLSQAIADLGIQERSEHADPWRLSPRQRAVWIATQRAYAQERAERPSTQAVVVPPYRPVGRRRWWRRRWM